MSEGDGPAILRPVPRRPFDLRFTGPTPPHEESLPSSPNPDPSVLNLDSLNRRLLDPRNNAPSTYDSASGSGSISRAQSILNLTSSTLFGIYSPTVYGNDRFYGENDELNTPWGTGAETPAKGLSMDEPHYEIQKERGHHMRRRSSLHPPQKQQPLSRPAVVLYIGLRALLLFGLGTLYGALVARFPEAQKFVGLQVEDRIQATMYDWRYLTFWGVSGVVLGGLLPWFDGVWESVFGQEIEVESAADNAIGGEEKEAGAWTDWALVVRGIGALVGIVFAIRKLPWDSTLQVSLALAMVNPFLWYLIDRSKPGFLLSTIVGLTGSTILMGLKPDMMPMPASHSSFGTSAGNASSSPLDPPMMLGGLASQQTVEAGIWMVSTLFCCCLCFGNIGRRLALYQSASTKGRWAERKTG